MGTCGDIAIVFEHHTHVGLLYPQCHSGNIQLEVPNFGKQSPQLRHRTSGIFVSEPNTTYILILVGCILGVQLTNRCINIASHSGYIQTCGLPNLYPLITSTTPLFVRMFVDYGDFRCSSLGTEMAWEEAMPRLGMVAKARPAANPTTEPLKPTSCCGQCKTN